MVDRSVPRRPTLLIILDGFGVNPSRINNAVQEADTPRLDEYFSRNSHTTLDACGSSVGLPDGQMGNSEVVHMTLGSGSVIRQDLVRINDEIESGEFFTNAALVAAESLDFEDAIKLVAKRGQLMQACVPEGEGAMAAIIGLNDDPIIQICNQVSEETDSVVEAVNFNSPGQVVIAGATAAVNTAMERLKEEGAKRALPLPVSVPSHSSLMKPAAEELAIYLKDVTINTPKIQVIHNADAKSHDEPDAIREALVKQLHNPVHWTQTIQIISDGADVIVECGPGKVLGGLTRRINKEVASASLDSMASMQKFLDSMSVED